MSKPAAPKKAVYRPEIFDVSDVDAAKRIILTDETGTTTHERWEVETPYLVQEIGRTLELDENACVLDYGCGIGRIAKGLIERYRCSVIGVDISASMRELAPRYVGSERFSVYAPSALRELISGGWRATHAYACWVLQHCARPDDDLGLIQSGLVPGAKLFVLNNEGRCVPTNIGWANDGISIEGLLKKRFEALEKGNLPTEITTPEIAAGTYVMTLRNPA